MQQEGGVPGDRGGLPRLSDWERVELSWPYGDQPGGSQVSPGGSEAVSDRQEKGEEGSAETPVQESS